MSTLPRAYWYLWLGAFINRLGGFVRPFLMLYLTQQRAFSTTEAGLVVSLYGAGSFTAAPVGGYLADRIGRRRTMLFSFTAGPVTMMLLALMRSPPAICALTLLLGFFSDLYRPAQHAAVSDLVPPAERTRAFGYIYWAVNLGFSAAAVIAGLMANRDFVPLFFADAATTLIFGTLVFLRVPESHPERHRSDRTPPRFTVPLQDGPFVGFLISQLLLYAVYTQVESTAALEMRSFGVTPATYGRLLAINGILIVLFQPLFAHLVVRFPRGRLLALAALLSGVGFGLTGVGHTPAWYALTIVVWTAGELLYSPLAPVVVTDLAPASLRGTYQGVFLATWGCASFLGPVVGAAVLERLGHQALWFGCLGLGLLSMLLHLAITPARRRRLAASPEGAAALAREEGRSVAS